MKKLLPALVALLAILVQEPIARAQGTITIALAQSVDINGRPLAGCFLYLYQVGTVATLQAVFSDPGLTNLLPNPLTCDQTGRLPMFYLASGSIHPRLTDAAGVVVVDIPSMLVIGPSGGGGGGGATVDPTTIFATGDIKFKASNETLVGWVKMNAQTIGNPTSGATQRANNDTQNLFVYLWGQCPQTHCPVSGTRGASGLADFNASKTIALPDWRSRGPVGLDDMGNTPAGILQTSNMTGSDLPTTPNGIGGEANHALVTAELAAHSHTISDPGHDHPINQNAAAYNLNYAVPPGSVQISQPVTASISMGNAKSPAGCTPGLNCTTTTGTGITGTNPTGSGIGHNTMPPFMLGSWYMKL